MTVVGASETAPRGGRTGRAMSAALVGSALLGVTVTVIWYAAGGGYYWPRWIWLGCLAVLAPLAIAVHLGPRDADPYRRLVGHADVGASVAGYVVLIWCCAGAAPPFWPVWVVLALAVLLAVHVLMTFRDRLPVFGRARTLSARVDTLTRSRRGALDVQTAQLQRIERDLHDGAQARLVALSMQLGRAETRLRDDPETAALVHSARVEAGVAIAELRDLARGIAPPILVDRGLAAAVRSLAERSGVAVAVTDDTLSGRLPPAVENAAYFVVSEALTNVAKHAPEATARLTLAQDGRGVVIDVVDDGPGGADPRSAGLDGLRTRVEALDGTFAVASPVGGPTVVHAELPCES